jgi:phosphopantothenoylcysteine decarboxylase
MSANLLAKVTGGLCDNLLTNTIRAWDVGASDPEVASIIVAPAMNDRMFSHPLTASQLAVLGGWKWFEVLPAQVKLLACGDLGQGGMCDWKEIVLVVEKRLATIDINQKREQNNT